MKQFQKQTETLSLPPTKKISSVTLEMDGEDPFNLLGAPVINHDPTIVLMDLESAPVPINRSNIARDCLVRLVRAKGWMGPLYIEGVVGDNTDDRISRRCFNRLLDSGIAITSIGIGDVKQVVDNYIYKKFEFIFDHHMNAPFNLVLVAADSDYLLWLQTFAGNDNSNFFLICYTVSAGEDMRSFDPQVSWAKILNAHQRYRKENNGPQLDNGPFYGHDEDGGPNGGPNTPFFARPEFYQAGREPGRPPGRLPEVPGYNEPQTFFRQQGLALNFGDEPGKQVRSAIKIKNTSKSHVAFKFQTTAPKSCFMRPTGAIPAPGETLIATVFKFVEPPENNEKPMDQRSRVKFEIMSLKVKGPMDYVPELFDEQKEDVSKEQILRVIFLDPECPNPALENLKRQLAEADAAVGARKKPPEETGPKMIGEGLVIDEWKQELGAEINPNPSLIERAIYCQ